MKTLLIVLLLSCLRISGMAQGNLEFSSTVYTHPERGRVVGTASFTLTGNVFDGRAYLDVGGNITSIRIQNSFGHILPATSVAVAPPITTSVASWSNITLDVAQASALVGGDYFINVITTQQPEGIVRGPIALVPEAGSLTLGCLGLILLLMPRYYRLACRKS